MKTFALTVQLITWSFVLIIHIIKIIYVPHTQLFPPLLNTTTPKGFGAKKTKTNANIAFCHFVLLSSFLSFQTPIAEHTWDLVKKEMRESQLAVDSVL